MRLALPSVALILLPQLSSGTESPAVDSPSGPPEELIPDAPTIWTKNINARVSAGYNDNLLLDAPRTEESFSLGAGLDASLIRLPLDGRQVLLYLTADYTRYPDGRQLDYEAYALALAQVKVDVSPRWQVGLDLQHLFVDQVVDTSITETNLSSSVVRGHGLTARPSIRADLASGFFASVDPAVTRQFFEQPFDDYWEAGSKLILGRDYGNRSSVALGYEWKHRIYDTREEVSLSGANLPGTELEFQAHEIELVWRHHWDTQRRWRTATRLGFADNRDSGPGYFDFQRLQGSQQVRYVAKEWEVKTQAKLSYYDFSNQPAEEPDSDQRSKLTASFTMRGERQLAKHLRVFAEYVFEESFSNRAADEYRVNKVAAGLDCGF